MKLRRLHLHRYGGFADAVLDLPQPEGADVTVILGANEAGKSTAFAAWLDLLFGIPLQTTAAWRFERKELDVAAEIETGGTTRLLRRLPTRTEDLRDGDGSVVVQGEVGALLHGLSRDGYRSRFSLDRGMLDSGGKDIAAGKGDLGALLFAGMAGLPGVQDALSRTQDAADSFVRIEGRRTRSTLLGAGVAELRENEAALKARLTPEVQARYDSAVEAAEDREAKAQAVLAEARRAEACERNAALLRERDAALSTIEETLATLPSCTWSPEEAEAARTALNASKAAIARQAEARLELEAAAGRLSEHTPDPNEGVAASVLDALEAMVVDDVPVLSRLGPVNDEDLARISQRRRDLGAGIAEARARFGLQTPATGLAERIEPVLRDVADARAAHNRAEQTVQRTTDVLEALPAVLDAGDVASLREALDTLRTLDIAGLRRDRDTKAAAREALGRDLVPNPLPDPGDLRTRVARHRSAVEALAAAGRDEVEASLRRDARRAVHVAAQEAASGADAAAAEAARQIRDAAWHRHRRTLDEDSADAFSEAMAAHDRVVAGLAEAATRAEAARAAARDAAEAEAAHSAAVRAIDEARDALADCGLATMAQALGLPSDAAPEALVPRLDRLLEIARASPLAARAEAALAAAWTSETQVHALLREMFSDADNPELAARNRLRDVEASAEARGRREAAEKEREAAAAMRDETQRTLTEAQQRCDSVLSSNGLQAVDLSDLAALRTLAADEDTDAREARRAEGLTHARAAADPWIAKLSVLGDLGKDPVAFARARARTDHAAVQARLQAQAAFDTARSALAVIDAVERRADEALARTLEGQGGEGSRAARVAALSEVARVLADRTTVLREIASVEGRHDVAALNVARALPPDPARLGTLMDAIAQAEAGHRDAIAAAHDARRARDEAQGGEVTANAVQARATLLVDLHRRARNAAATMLGHMAGQAALERLVHDNRGTMVAAASETFRRITGGEWDGLEVFGPDGMTLVARRGNRRVSVDRLSEGTRAQLFLSLRVAGHAAFCERHGPLPFVTDDILEAFDDTRAEAALCMAGEMGTVGQVVFLTHHPHIAALAERAIPGVSVINMPRQG